MFVIAFNGNVYYILMLTFVNFLAFHAEKMAKIIFLHSLYM